jgi:hypothetical protein
MRHSILFVLSAALAAAPAQEPGRVVDAPKAKEQAGTVAQKPAPVQAVRFPDFDPNHPPPAELKSPFRLSQDFPETYRRKVFPWMDIDFAAHPNEYLKAVLAYCLEGNLEVEFRGDENQVRKWYHAPWLHDDGKRDGAGREYHRGLTRERRSRPFELHRLQEHEAQNWGVSLYNDRGGYTLGKVWRTPSGFPDPWQATFPENTVSFKLLFTDATLEQVPFLAGSLEWTANIYENTDFQPPRVDRKVRLLQIDLAVKDPRVASTTGWIFGTFIYDGSAPGKSVWDRMIPVGLTWGDDPNVRAMMNRTGAFVNTRLKETRINSSLVEVADWSYGKRAYVRHYGLGGRLNGPVDNPASSCISCHGRAAIVTAGCPSDESCGKPMAFALDPSPKPGEFPIDQFDQFFSLVRGMSHIEEVDGRKFVTTDYSLQLSAGIRNFYQSLRSKQPASVKLLSSDSSKRSSAKSAKMKAVKVLPEVTRDIDEGSGDTLRRNKEPL